MHTPNFCIARGCGSVEIVILSFFANKISFLPFLLLSFIVLFTFSLFCFVFNSFIIKWKWYFVSALFFWFVVFLYWYHLSHQQFCKMSSVPRQCPGVSGKACNHFLSSIGKVFHEINSTCHLKSYSKDIHCKHCAGWCEEKWEKVRAYLDKLAIQCERERERKSSSSFSGFQAQVKFPYLFLCSEDLVKPMRSCWRLRYK